MPGNHAHHTLPNYHINHTNRQWIIKHKCLLVNMKMCLSVCLVMVFNCTICNRFFSVFCIVHASSAAIYQTHGQAHTCTECETNSQYPHIFEFVHSNPCFLLFSARVSCLLVWKLLVRSIRQHSTIRTHPYIYNHSHLQSMLHLLIQIKNKLKPTLSFTNSSTSLYNYTM